MSDDKPEETGGEVFELRERIESIEEKRNDEIKSIIQRIDSIEEESREDIPARSIDYHLWTLFFTLGFLVLSFVFSGDVDHYLHHLSNPPISFSISRDNPNTLVLERYSIQFLHDQTPSDIHLLIQIKDLEADLDAINSLLTIGCSLDSKERSSFSNYSIDSVAGASFVIKIGSFKTKPLSGELCDRIFVDFPAENRQAFSVINVGVGVDVKVLSKIATKWFSLSGKVVWYIKSGICIFIFGIFTYVIYFNCKTFLRYFKEFQKYANFVWKWIAFIGMERLDDPDSTSDPLEEENLLGQYKTMSDPEQYGNNAQKYLYGRGECIPIIDDSQKCVYRILLSPGKYRYWSKVIAILKPIEFIIEYYKERVENGQTKKVHPRISLKNWRTENLNKFEPTTEIGGYGFYIPFKWMLWPQAILYIFTIGGVIFFILTIYLQTIRSSSAIVFVTSLVILVMILKDLIWPYVKKLLGLFQEKSDH